VAKRAAFAYPRVWMSAVEDDPSLVERLCAEQRYDDATAVLLRRHGSEVLGVLVAMVGDDAVAADAYSLFCERLWRGLPKFRFECACRTWAYTIARRSLYDVLRKRRAAAEVLVSPSGLPEVVALAASSTAPHLRTTNEQKLQAARASLSHDDQLLVVLRIDKQMSWSDVALVLGDGDQTPEQLASACVVLRKRFSRIKDRLARALRSAADRGNSPA
jgi:RNA polymerase sigma-70 factor (ECF subfamily)